MDERLKKLTRRLDDIQSYFGDSEKLTIIVKNAIDDTEHNRKVEDIRLSVNIIMFMVIVLGVANLLLLWGLAK